MNPSRDAGTRWERAAAKLLGGKRVIRSSFGESAPDVISARLVAECKWRKKLAIEGWLRQVEEHKQPGKTCIVLCRQPGGQAIAVLRAVDFLAILNKQEGPDD